MKELLRNMTKQNRTEVIHDSFLVVSIDKKLFN